MFFGTGTAIITPMKDGKIDTKSLEKIIDFQIKNKIDAIFPCGTTGEIATLSEQEYEEIIKITTEKAYGKAKIIAGIGGNNTNKVVKYAKICEKYNVDGVLAVCPYYNKPNQEGIFSHFSKIANETNLKIMLYNVPSRTVTNISDETIIRLIQNHENIVAIKDATGNPERICDLRAKMIDKKIPLERFQMFCGDDSTSVGFIAMGGVGLISVASNFIPKEINEMVKLALSENFKKARAYQDKYNIICQKMFIETNPSPVKFTMYKLGFCENETRLPLVKLSKSGEVEIENEMKKLSII